MGKILALLSLSLIAAGCMSPRSTQTSTMLNGDTGLVSVLGNKPADRDKVYAASLAEAARLARTHGYQYFIVLKANDRSVTIVKYGLEQSIPYDFTGRSGTKALGSTNLSPTHVPGATFVIPGRAVPFLKPGLEITVKMYHEGEVDSHRDGVWNVDFIPKAAEIVF